MSAETPALEVTGVSASYGTVPVVRDAALRIPRGSIVTIIGANGAGKSTLIKTICGLMRPVAGMVRLFGEDVTGLSADRLVRKGLSAVPEGRRLFSEMTVLENLELGAYARSGSDAIKQSLNRVFDLFPDLRQRQPAAAGKLSGGQQQMVAVARALMSAPRVLCLDEPTIGLAPAVVARIADAIHSIAQSGVEILLVEQNAEMALAVADYAYVMEGGSIIAEGPSAVLSQSPSIQSAYLGI